MRPRYRVSRTAIELIKRFEGYRRQAAQLPDGRWTIGYGHTLTAREGAQVSEEDAEALLLYDLIAIAHAVNEGVYTPLTQNQFDALCSFAFNLGIHEFRRSEVLKRLNEGRLVEAACGMELWRKSYFEGDRIVVDALVRRRASEKALFLTPPGEAFVPAPSPLLRPLIDQEARALLPSSTPVVVQPLLEGERAALARDGEGEPAPWTAETDGQESPIRAAAEAVTDRLQAIYPQEPTPAEDAPRAVEPEPIPDPAVGPEAFAAPEPPIAAEPADEPDPAAPDVEPAPVALEATPPAPLDLNEPDPADPPPLPPRRVLIDDLGVPDFEPATVVPIRSNAAREPSLITDVLIGLLGLAFFGFAAFWGLNARGEVGAGVVNPLMVAWLAGIAGIGFFVVAVFRLLERLGRD